jgi:6-phosphogluconolactonase
MPWPETELFQVDERIASPGSEDRNLTHLVLGLSLEHQSALRPMPVTQRDLDAAAREYESSLPEKLDLVHLGLGPDGHTASLVPGDSVLEVSDRRVALTEDAYQDHRRMTLTYPELAAARRIVWLVTGAEKREPLAKLLAGDDSIPAGRVANEDMVVVADEAAAP